MKLGAITAGMKLVAIGDYADCIKVGDRFVAYELDGELHVSCRGGGGSSVGRCHHDLSSTANRRGNIPELAPA